MQQAYTSKRIGADRMRLIETSNEICAEYAAQGYDLTLRQVYYQLVARGIIPNSERSYKNLGDTISDARLVGVLDWDYIVDRTRQLRLNSHWQNPQEILRSAVSSFAIDKWENQPRRIEVWIEKDALVGVIASICKKLDVAYFSCRGYTSQSEMREAGERLARYISREQEPLILHLGDHDPSGIDMTRDIEDRLEMFARETVEVRRLALNMDQIRQFNPPPNPAKITDSRAADYIDKHGKSSWELDALNPTTLSELVENAVLAERDDDLWREAVNKEHEFIRQLREVQKNWTKVVANI